MLGNHQFHQKRWVKKWILQGHLPFLSWKYTLKDFAGQGKYIQHLSKNDFVESIASGRKFLGPAEHEPLF